MTTRAPLLALLAVVGCATVGVKEVANAVEGPDDVIGFRSGHALFYVVPVDGGVVLVDTGFDESGADIAAAVGGRTVKAVLLTHAHVDHWSGVSALGDVDVYVGSADGALLRRERTYRSLTQQLITVAWPTPQLPTKLHDVADGAVVEVGADRFVALALPGHTPGSTVWLWRDIAFSGDAVFGDGGSVDVAPAVLSDDDAQARRSIARLWGASQHVLLDGHGGRTDDLPSHVQRFLDDGGAR